MSTSKALERAALQGQCRDPYRQSVPQNPKNFVIERVTVTPLDARFEPVRTSPTAGVPPRFRAEVHLSEPRLVVYMTVRVIPPGQPRVTEIEIRADPRDSISTTTLRRVLVDPMLRAALTEAETPIEAADHIHPGAYRFPGAPEGTYWVSPHPSTADERVPAAAAIYKSAVAAGSKAPTEAVALELRVSKASASRYVRAARAAGLLPKIKDRQPKSGVWKVRDQQS